MTLLMAIQTRDGLVVASDGRTSDFDVPIGEYGHLVPAGDDTRKLVIVRGTSIVALVGGRAAFDVDGPEKTRTTASFCSDFLNEEFGLDSGAPTDGLTVERVATVLLQRLADLYRAHNSKVNGFAIVAGYSTGKGMVDDAEVWELVIPGPEAPHHDQHPLHPAASPSKSFREHGLCLMQWGWSAPLAMSQRLFRNPDHDPDGPHELAAHSSAEVLELLATRLPQIVAEAPETTFDGVGGEWQVAVVNPSPQPVGEPRLVSPIYDSSEFLANLEYGDYHIDEIDDD